MSIQLSAAGIDVFKSDPLIKYQGIQALRGLASLLVLLAHLEFLAYGPHWWSSHSAAMAVGVDIFFVISGFVVSITLERAASMGSFLRSRIIRVLPLYLAASFPMIFIEQMDFSRVWNTFFFFPIFDFGEYSTPAHWFGWSIGLELWYYTALGFCLVVADRFAVVAFCGAMTTLVLLVGSNYFEWMLPRFIGNPLALEFVFGAIIYKGLRYLRRPMLLFCAGLSMLAATLFWLPTLGNHLVIFADFSAGMQRAVLWGVPASLLVASVIVWEREGMRWNRRLVWLGDISYSFYLVQPLVIVCLLQVILPWFVVWPALVLLNLLSASAVNRYVEVPLTNWIRSRLRKNTVRENRD